MLARKMALKHCKRSRKTVDTSLKEVSLTFLTKEGVYWYKTGSDRKAKRFMTV